MTRGVFGVRHHVGPLVRIFSVFTLLVATTTLLADEFPAEDLEFFEKKIRPVLIEKCGECHSSASDPVQGGLRLDTRRQLLRGGDSGPAVVAGKPDESLLIDAIRYGDLYQMPPSGKLSDQVVANFEQWVREGAAAPTEESTPAAEPDAPDADPARQHWAFQPVTDAPPPAPQTDRQAGWASNGIDLFVIDRLREGGLDPSPRADKYTLIRRAYFDLIGMPPSPTEVQAFLADDSPGAFESVVERLLASPRYGERWGRHWLDLARYADTNGADENYVYHHAWRYRDYVFRAFNQDKPYDRFLTEQLAGDLLPQPADPQAANDQLTATGFLVLGPKMLAEQDKEKLVVDLVDEQIDTVGKTFLGLTLGCARCHDHKFDPLPTEDYYALAGLFLSTRTMDHLNHVSEWLERPLPANGKAQHYAELEAEIRAKTKQRERLPDDDKLTADQKKQKKRLAAEIEKLQEQLAQLPTVMAVKDRQPRDVPVHIRGSHLNLADEPVPRGTIGLFDDRIPEPEIPDSTSGRLELAQWMTDPRNPLTARVMVNRIWQGHFGTGLVRTPSDFGLRGTPPTHPRLLDWLAQRFVESGWSIKALHRLMMLSKTYQMASSHMEPQATADPKNQLLWRQNRQRLEAEPLRDALLAVTGDIDLSIGGNLEDTPDDSKYARTTEAPYELPRRAVYLPVVRNRAYEMFAVFDYVDSAVHLAKRSATTVPHQSLFMMNNPLVLQQAEELAADLLKTHAADQRLERAYLRLYSRPIRPAERELAKQYLDALMQQPSPLDELRAGDGKTFTEQTRRELAWTSLCRTLLAANEFLYID